ncbi:hypothetical protein ABMA27_015299 [Loxostege sticticalis]|uniref:Insertion element IS150 protein InsJ-like helix-turn-helix domain-containing protein n=1 Tax=Loxostege sticticalis TaxID=481309 RepID=A0ABR3I739_LOXSC
MPAPLRREQREQIIALKRSGYKVTEIERWTGVSRKCIYFWLRRWEESGDISAHHRAVYQRATTAEQDAAIVAAHEANPFKPTRETSSEYSIRHVCVSVCLSVRISQPLFSETIRATLLKLSNLRERRFQSGKMCPPPPVTSKIRK